jgi:hypothetical protein
LPYPYTTSFVFSQTPNPLYASIDETTSARLTALQDAAAELFRDHGGMTAIHNAQDCRHRIVDLTYGLYPQPPGALFSIKMSPQFWLCVPKPCPVFPNNMARTCLDPVSIIESGHAESNTPFTISPSPDGKVLLVTTKPTDAFAHISHEQQLFGNLIGGLIGGIAGAPGAVAGAAAFNKLQSDAVNAIAAALSSSRIKLAVPPIPVGSAQNPLYQPILVSASLVDEGGGALGLSVHRHVTQMKDGSACWLQTQLQSMIPPPVHPVQPIHPNPNPIHPIHPLCVHVGFPGGCVRVP